MPNWRDKEVGAPEIARLGAPVERRAGGDARHLAPGPFASWQPTEPFLVHGRLLVGAMAWSIAQISANRS